MSYYPYAEQYPVNRTMPEQGRDRAEVQAELKAIAGERGAVIPILYGGSVNKSNVESLLAAEEVDGVLVGGSSLDAEEWLAIVRSS